MTGVSLIGSSVVAYVFNLSGGGSGRTVMFLEMLQDISALSFHPNGSSDKLELSGLAAGAFNRCAISLALNLYLLSLIYSNMPVKTHVIQRYI